MAKSNVHHANEFCLNHNADSLTTLMKRAKGDVHKVLAWVKEAREKPGNCGCCGSFEFDPAFQVYCIITIGMQGNAGEYTSTVVEACADIMVANEECLVMIGTEYLLGNHLKKDFDKGFELLCLAEKSLDIEKDHKDFIGNLYYNLGYIHYHGLGTEVNKAEAKVYFTKSASYGTEDGIQALKNGVPPTTHE